LGRRVSETRRDLFHRTSQLSGSFLARLAFGRFMRPVRVDVDRLVVGEWPAQQFFYGRAFFR
jgi:hypothetical protein